MINLGAKCAKKTWVSMDTSTYDNVHCALHTVAFDLTCHQPLMTWQLKSKGKTTLRW